VDFRPYIDTIVLNNKVDGRWQTEVRPAFSSSTFVSGDTFKVTIEVLDGEYKISFNDEEIGARFPQRDDLALATAVALYGGSNGFQWTYLRLPELRIAVEKSSYPLSAPLKVGDVIKAWGVYVDDTTSKFNVNIIGDDGIFLLHVDFRPYIDTIVLNNKVDGRWQTEVRPAFSSSTFVSGDTFKVTIEVLDGEYKISFNDEEIGARFPQRDDLALATAVALYGGSNGFKWTYLSVP